MPNVKNIMGRYGNHKKSFKFQRYKNDTELSKYIWELNSNALVIGNPHLPPPPPRGNMGHRLF
jgi:hypothetical protein